jgi:hypothetical protein
VGTFADSGQYEPASSCAHGFHERSELRIEPRYQGRNGLAFKTKGRLCPSK